MSAQRDRPLFARFFDLYCGRDRGTGEWELRRELLAGAHGTVVEVGAGNGISFEHYPPTVRQLIAVEPEPYLRRRAQSAAESAPMPTRVIDGTAAAIDLPTGGADVLVVCGVLCSVPDQAEALAEFRRVLRRGGELRFYEHVLSRRAGFARWQRLVNPVWSRMMGGCQTDRDTLGAITAAGFTPRWCRGFGFPPDARSRPVAPRIIGVAASPGAR